MTSAPRLPNYLGLPFRILVSPFVHFDPETRTTDIMMFNSRNLGALIVAEEPHVKSWEDGQYNILNMSIEETYGFGMSRQGRPSRLSRAGRSAPTSSQCRLTPCITWSLHPAGQHKPRARARDERPLCDVCCAVWRSQGAGCSREFARAAVSVATEDGPAREDERCLRADYSKGISRGRMYLSLRRWRFHRIEED